MKGKDLSIDTTVKQAISSKMAWYYRVVPVDQESDVIKVLMDRGRQINGIQKELEVALGKKVSIELIDGVDMDEALARNYPRNETGTTVASIPKTHEVFPGSSTVFFELSTVM